MKQYLPLNLSKKCEELGLVSESGKIWETKLAGPGEVLIPESSLDYSEGETYPAFELSDFLLESNARKLWGEEEVNCHGKKEGEFWLRPAWKHWRHELIDGDWIAIVSEALNGR